MATIGNPASTPNSAASWHPAYTDGMYSRGIRPPVTLFSNSFFFQAEDGIRDADVTGVQTCALPICKKEVLAFMLASLPSLPRQARCTCLWDLAGLMRLGTPLDAELLKLKIANQRYTTAVYLKHIEKLACDLPSVINDGELAQTMQPLLPVDIYERTACDSRFRRYLVAVLGELLSDVKELLAQQSGTQPAFRM